MRPQGRSGLTHHGFSPRRPDTVEGEAPPEGVLVEVCERQRDGGIPVIVYGPPEFLVQLFAKDDAIEIQVGLVVYRVAIHRIDGLLGGARPYAAGWLDGQSA